MQQAPGRRHPEGWYRPAQQRLRRLRSGHVSRSHSHCHPEGRPCSLVVQEGHLQQVCKRGGEGGRGAGEWALEGRCRLITDC